MSAGRVLVVDDEPQIRRVMRVSLTGEGYELEDARTGEEALEKLRGRRFDLMILDMNMPGIGGLEVCRRARALSDLAILMLTIRNTEEDKVQALDAGADDFITKPFGMPELLARIRAALRRMPLSPDAGPHRLTLEGVEVDFQARKLIAHGTEVRLTPKEFDLLRYLVAHPNKALSHRELLQSVWGPDYGEQVEYLRVFIKQLRRKLEPQPDKPRYILTEPWVGYRFHLPEV
jgi:two-component system, OmpR family, KDP operon response regulator KdpE